MLLKSSLIRVDSVCSRAVSALEESDQGLQCLLKSNLITVYSIPEKQFDLCLQCLLKSILTRVYNVCFRAVCS